MEMKGDELTEGIDELPSSLDHGMDLSAGSSEVWIVLNRTDETLAEQAKG
jgi:hypothetical protein